MINSKQSFLFYLEADRIALGRQKVNFFSVKKLKSILIPDYIWTFQKLMRKIEFYKNCRQGPIPQIYYAYLSWKYHRLSLKLGFSISVNTFGPGLSIAHSGTIIINSGARIGANCRMNCDVNIGTQAGYANKAPQIGDSVYIGPGAKIYGDIQIANNTAIGANAVVNKSFLKENTAIAGVPAKVISENIDVFDLLVPAASIANGELKEIFGLPAQEQNKLRKAK